MPGEYTVRVITNVTKNDRKATFTFNVDTEEKANAHALQILRDGYRRVIDDTTFVWISPYSIQAVQVSGPIISTGYSDIDVT